MTRLTILNSMASLDLEVAINLHADWGLQDLDLKDAVFDKTVIELSDTEIGRIKALAEARGIEVYCLSSLLFGHPVESGEERFRCDLDALDRLLEIARVLQPRLIRLLAPSLARRHRTEDSVSYLRREHPWLIPVFAEAVGVVSDAGYTATIENECPRSIFATPSEVLGFFAALEGSGELVFTWDVQNMWQMGTFPSLEACNELIPVLGYLHLKGGQHDGSSQQLRWRSGLHDASWPVVEITEQVIGGGQCPVICLNPSHGDDKPGYDYCDMTKRDLDFLRGQLPQVA